MHTGEKELAAGGKSVDPGRKSSETRGREVVAVFEARQRAERSRKHSGGGQVGREEAAARQNRLPQLVLYSVRAAPAKLRCPRSTRRTLARPAVPVARHANVERPAPCTCNRVLHRCSSALLPSLLLPLSLFRLSASRFSSEPRSRDGIKSKSSFGV